MRYSWNFVYYTLFVINNKISEIVRIPIRWLIEILYKNKRVKVHFHKKGLVSVSDFINVLKMADENRKSGLSILLSNFVIFWILAIFISLITVVLLGISEMKRLPIETNKMVLYVLFLIISVYSLNHYILYRNDIYLSYFDKFDKLGKMMKYRYGVLTLIFIIATPVLWWISMKYFFG